MPPERVLTIDHRHINRDRANRAQSPTQAFQTCSRCKSPHWTTPTGRYSRRHSNWILIHCKRLSPASPVSVMVLFLGGGVLSLSLFAQKSSRNICVARPINLAKKKTVRVTRTVCTNTEETLSYRAVSPGVIVCSLFPKRNHEKSLRVRTVIFVFESS